MPRNTRFQSYPASEEMLVIYDKLARETEQHIAQANAASTHPLLVQMRGLHEAIMMVRAGRDVVQANALLQKVGTVLVQWLTADKQLW